MKIRFENRTGFIISGYSVETSLNESGRDVAALYDDYFKSEKAVMIDNAAKSSDTEYYGLMWYLNGHERYRYLLRKETDKPSVILADAETKEIAAEFYAVASFEKEDDGVKAWTDFFFEAIPQAGYAPDYEHGFLFEYYPNGVNGNYELWTPVVKS